MLAPLHALGMQSGAASTSAVPWHVLKEPFLRREEDGRGRVVQHRHACLLKHGPNTALAYIGPQLCHGRRLREAHDSPMLGLALNPSGSALPARVASSAVRKSEPDGWGRGSHARGAGRCGRVVVVVIRVCYAS